MLVVFVGIIPLAPNVSRNANGLGRTDVNGDEPVAARKDRLTFARLTSGWLAETMSAGDEESGRRSSSPSCAPYAASVRPPSTSALQRSPCTGRIVKAAVAAIVSWSEHPRQCSLKLPWLGAVV